MYSTFSVKSNANAKAKESSLASQPRSRRNHVSVACDPCRKNRVKCNSSRPCRNCENRGISCKSNSMNTRVMTRQIQELTHKVNYLEACLQDSDVTAPLMGIDHDKAPSPDELAPSELRVSIGSHVQYPRSVHDTTLDFSTAAFAAKLKTLLAVDISFPGKFPPHPPFSGQIQECHSSSAGSSPQGELIRPIQDYYIRISLRSINKVFPVLDEDDFRDHYDSLWSDGTNKASRRSCYVTDILLALSLQLESNSKPEQGLGLPMSHNECSKNDRDRVGFLAEALYRRCLTSLSSDLETPSLHMIQAYIMMVVYLRNSSNQNTATQVLGSAIRAAYALDLHKSTVKGMPDQVRNLRQRLWNLLSCFDTQQFLELGRPCGMAPHVHHCSDSPVEADSTFISHYLSLMDIARSSHESLDAVLQQTNNVEHQDGFSADPKVLQRLEPELIHTIQRLDQWRDQVPPVLRLPRRSFGKLLTADLACDIDADAPLWRLRQCLLLELSYHWISAGVLRCCIQLDGGCSTLAASVGTNAEMAVRHVLVITRIINQALVETEAIHGWYDSHFIFCDAVLTLAAFIHSRAAHPLAQEAHTMISACMSNFDMVGTRLEQKAALTMKALSATLHSGLATTDGSIAATSISSLQSENATLGPTDSGPDLLRAFDIGDHDISQFLLSDYDGGFELAAQASTPTLSVPNTAANQYASFNEYVRHDTSSMSTQQ